MEQAPVTLTMEVSVEFLGGSAVIAAGFPTLGIGFVGVSLAFGLTVLRMAFAIGYISGCHLSPAVTSGLVAASRHSDRELLPTRDLRNSDRSREKGRSRKFMGRSFSGLTRSRPPA